MKTSVYIENGISQINLTPENDFEKNVLINFKNKPSKIEFSYDEFYLCQGGQIRLQDKFKNNLMLTLKEEKKS